MRRFGLGCSLALLVGAFGCGGGGGGGDPGASGKIGPAGGSVSIAGGPSIVIPPGALASETTIRIRASGAESPDGEPVHVFEPEDLELAQPATVSFPLPAGLSGATVYWAVSGSAALFDALSTSVAASRAHAQVSRLSRGHAGASCTAQAPCSPANECRVGELTCTTGAPVCVQQEGSLEDGTACSTGVCSAGVCEAACHAVGLDTAPVVDVVYIPATAPNPTGGTVGSGTYLATEVNAYGPTGAASTFQGIWVVDAATVRGAYGTLGGVDRWTATLATASTALSLTGTCGFDGTVTYTGYTASAAELRLYFDDGVDTTWEYVYTKQ